MMVWNGDGESVCAAAASVDPCVGEKIVFWHLEALLCCLRSLRCTQQCLVTSHCYVMCDLIRQRPEAHGHMLKRCMGPSDLDKAKGEENGL